MDDNAVLQAKAMMEALAQQRNQTADMVVQLVGENAVLQKQLESAKAIAAETLKTAQALCGAYHNAIVADEPGSYPENDPEVLRLRALLGVKDE
jgi:hypothetical protein